MKRLKIGDTIGIVAPASPAKTKTEIKRAIFEIEKLGFKVKLGESVGKTFGYLSGEDNIRARDINNMFKDKEVDGIICLRGGYGCPRILDSLDLEMIKENKKPFVGYSDITALHITFNRLCNMATFHGPMAVSDFSKGLDDYTLKYFKKILMENPVGEIENPQGEQLQILCQGECQGEIVGGNLALIVASLGTPYEIDTKDKILFIEEVGEKPYSIDRMLTQLKLAGKLDQSRGIVLGDFEDCGPSKNSKVTINDVFAQILTPIGKPLYYNFQSGHCSPLATLPLGVKAQMKDGKVNILESPFED